MPYKGDKSAAHPPKGCPAEAGGLFGPESALGFEHPSGTNARQPSQKAGSAPCICRCLPPDTIGTRSKARRPIKVGINGRGRSGTSRDSNPACLCCSSAHLVQFEPDEASSFTNPNVGQGTYASLRLKLDAWSSAVQRGQKCSSPTRRLPSLSWGPIRPRVCSWFRAPIWHECQTAQPKRRERALYLTLPPTRHDLTQGQKPEGQLKWG